MSRGRLRRTALAAPAALTGLALALSACGAGRARMEGKEYVMRDGDVVEFRFNV